jgi:hypothetical protein
MQTLLIRPIVELARRIRNVLVVGKKFVEMLSVFMLPFDSTFHFIVLSILTDTGVRPVKASAI